jgi:hypothetical protein
VNAHESDVFNPDTFDTDPPFARFFVIKSYSEDDVHKSIKYNIWASTDTGNKRLDTAYRESVDKGPIYLFFSVNMRFCIFSFPVTDSLSLISSLNICFNESFSLFFSLFYFVLFIHSGQFCGMAQMTSPVDYEKKCNYWTQDKWKGIFQVKWIFVKDIPNNRLRHIRLRLEYLDMIFVIYC